MTSSITTRTSSLWSRGSGPAARAGGTIVLALFALALSVGSCTSSEPTSTAVGTPQATRSPSSETSPPATLPISGRGWIAYQAPLGSSPDRIFLAHIDGSRDHPIAKALPGSIAHPDFFSQRLAPRLRTAHIGSGPHADLRRVSRRSRHPPHRAVRTPGVPRLLRPVVVTG
jgi:hypothetical protein